MIDKKDIFNSDKTKTMFYNRTGITMWKILINDNVMCGVSRDISSMLTVLSDVTYNSRFKRQSGVYI